MSESLEQFEIDEGRIQRLERALDNAQRALDDEKRRKAGYEAKLYEAVSDAFSAFKVAPVKAPKLSSRGKSGEVAVPLLSDTQLGKVTASGSTIDYTTEKAVERVAVFADKVIELTEIQRSHHPVNDAVVVCLGDIVEGFDIFPGQQWLIDSGLYRQVVVAAEMLANYVRKLLTSFETVKIYGIIGNHGRIGRRGNADPETNMDRMVYYIAKMALKDEPRVSWVIPEGPFDRNWYSIVEIGNYRAMGIHGDQIRGHSGFPWYGLGKKVQGWAAGGIPEQFTDVFMGHWHQLARIPLNSRSVYVNGSTESGNAYAAENLAAQSDPMQWLLYVSPEKGCVTASYGVDLR